ncbi:MAG: hypothetical protein O7H39_08520, partial [Gammaproteobacteria bacterium]|nr:hypothetical protein [Gammaproteobacteria bacterium]
MAVIGFEPTRRIEYADGREFGDVGAYEQIDATLHFAVDPQHPANSSIVDLALAPRDGDGCVRFSADFSVVFPSDARRASGVVLVELPNRGRRRVIDMLNRSGAEAAASPAAGDGFL